MSKSMSLKKGKGKERKRESYVVHMFEKPGMIMIRERGLPGPIHVCIL
jgi:hypothetical protein